MEDRIVDTRYLRINSAARDRGTIGDFEITILPDQLVHTLKTVLRFSLHQLSMKLFYYWIQRDKNRTFIYQEGVVQTTITLDEGCYDLPTEFPAMLKTKLDAASTNYTWAAVYNTITGKYVFTRTLTGVDTDVYFIFNSTGDVQSTNELFGFEKTSVYLPALTNTLTSTRICTSGAEEILHFNIEQFSQSYEYGSPTSFQRLTSIYETIPTIANKFDSIAYRPTNRNISPQMFYVNPAPSTHFRFFFTNKYGAPIYLDNEYTVIFKLDIISKE